MGNLSKSIATVTILRVGQAISHVCRQSCGNGQPETILRALVHKLRVLIYACHNAQTIVLLLRLPDTDK